MTHFIDLVGSEWQKLLSRNKSKVLLILLAIGVFAVDCAYFIMEKSWNLSFMEGKQFPIWVLELLLQFILPLFVMMVAGDIFAGEFQDGTIKNAFSLPTSRTKLFAAKFGAGALYIGSALGVIAFFSLLGAIIVSGFSSLLGLGDLLIAYFGVFLILGLLLVLSATISLFVGSPSFSLVINLLVWLGMGAAGAFSQPLHTFLPTSFTHWYEPILMGGSLKPVVQMLLYTLSYYIIVTAVGLMKFQKKEV